MNACIEVSAFAIVVWSTYPHVKMFKFLALVRTLVTQATMYFIVVIAVHIFVLVVASLGIVRSFAHFHGVLRWLNTITTNSPLLNAFISVSV